MLTVSGVCICSRCEVGERRVYRMIGSCWNCDTEPILMLFRSGDRTSVLDCPRCGCKEVHAIRHATDDEIPEAAAPAESDGAR